MKAQLCHPLSEPDYDRQHAEPEDRSQAYTVMHGQNLEHGADYPSFNLALIAYRDKRAFTLTRECPDGYQLELMPPDGVTLTAVQYAAMFSDTYALARLEMNPHGKAPNSCGHGRVRGSKLDSALTEVVCLVCSHRWKEHKIS